MYSKCGFSYYYCRVRSRGQNLVIKKRKPPTRKILYQSMTLRNMRNSAFKTGMIFTNRWEISRIGIISVRFLGQNGFQVGFRRVSDLIPKNCNIFESWKYFLVILLNRKWAILAEFECVGVYVGWNFHEKVLKIETGLFWSKFNKCPKNDHILNENIQIFIIKSVFRQ